jgi:dienelactone hydrolase
MGIAQKTITFPSKDGITITADFYSNKSDEPWLLLFHQAGYSRGEYKETAEKFVKFGYNCLAVDLRSGSEVNFIKNKTAEEAKGKNLPTEYMDAKQDMESAVEYAYKQSNQPVVILGSSYSASLCLLLLKENKHVKAGIVFSPGEYFDKENFIQNEIAGLDKPVFAASSANEYPYVKDLFKQANQSAIMYFKPVKGPGVHGSKTLWANNNTNGEYWLELMVFFRQLNERAW